MLSKFQDGDIIESNGIWYTVRGDSMYIKSDTIKRPLNEDSKLVWRRSGDSEKVRSKRSRQ